MKTYIGFATSVALEDFSSDSPRNSAERDVKTNSEG